MSTFSSLCHDKDHNDQIDIAFSFFTDEIRLIIWKDPEHWSPIAFLTLNEAKHVLELLDKAIQYVEDTLE